MFDHEAALWRDATEPGGDTVGREEPLEDVAVGTASQATALDWVGMQGIALPLMLAGRGAQARVSAGVSLDDPEARGIHMSRLYLALEALEDREPTPARLKTLLEAFLDSHQGLSQRAFVEIEGSAVLRRAALVSPLAGWKGYPLRLTAQLGPQGFAMRLDLEVGYSSTCPCSAALARQLIQQRFDADFAAKGGDDLEASVDRASVRAWLGSADGIVATPHSQRSVATLSLRLDPLRDQVPVVEVIDEAEAALGTALQTAVKRVDEQAFALANGQNLMFCEDAARRLHATFLNRAGIAGFRLGVVHAESLHAHDAVARSSWRWSWNDGGE